MRDPNAHTAPIHSDRILAEEWLRRRTYRAAELDTRLQLSIAFDEQGLEPGDARLRECAAAGEGGFSWLGGPALGIAPSEWPRRTDGIPLAHVATVNLWDVDQSLPADIEAEWPEWNGGLPDHGVLQVFHDLSITHGDDDEDATSGGWRVQWLPDPDLTQLTDGPDDLDLPTDGVCQVYRTWGTWSFPIGDPTSPRSAAALRAESKAQEDYQWMWSWQRTLVRGSRPLPITHLYGHPQNDTVETVGRILPRRLPLTVPGDSYRLIIEIESWTALADWFGDAHPLEIWMRQSDLEARRFDAAWCITRSDC